MGYDGRGNLTSVGTDTYSFTAENQLDTAVTHGPGGAVSSTNAYDPLGRMHWYRQNLVFTYDGGNILAELGAGNAIQRRYVYGPGMDEPVVWYEGAGTSQKYWLHADERGSVNAVTDSSGNVVGTNTYDEYGVPGAGNMGRFQYTGQAWLPEIGLYYYKARMYSPTLGRFLQTDPVGYGGGLNKYAYVSGDPVNSTDPSGLWDTRVFTGSLTGRECTSCSVSSSPGPAAGNNRPGDTQSGGMVISSTLTYTDPVTGETTTTSSGSFVIPYLPMLTESIGGSIMIGTSSETGGTIIVTAQADEQKFSPGNYIYENMLLAAQQKYEQLNKFVKNCWEGRSNVRTEEAVVEGAKAAAEKGAQVTAKEAAMSAIIPEYNAKAVGSVALGVTRDFALKTGQEIIKQACEK